jgi:hypothetical protein
MVVFVFASKLLLLKYTFHGAMSIVVCVGESTEEAEVVMNNLQDSQGGVYYFKISLQRRGIEIYFRQAICPRAIIILHKQIQGVHACFKKLKTNL